MFKFLYLLISFFLVQQNTLASNSYVTYGDLSSWHNSDEITIAYGDENLIYKLDGEKILFYKIPYGTKFKIQQVIKNNEPNIKICRIYDYGIFKRLTLKSGNLLS